MLTGYVCSAAGSDLGATKGLTTLVFGVQVALLVSSGLGLIPNVWGVVYTVISPLCGTVQLAPLPLPDQHQPHGPRNWSSRTC